MSIEYRDPPKLVGKFKLAAIDVYIDSSSNFSLDKNFNCYVLSGRLGNLDMSISMSHLNADGTGGGEFASPERIERGGYKEPSDQTRKRVGETVKPRMDLPNPYLDSFSGKINKYREKVATVLSEISIGGFDPITKTADISTTKLQSFDKIVPGRMRTLLKGMNDYASVLEDSVFNMPRATFVASMPSVIGDLALLARVHGETSLVEQLFLKQLRKKVVEAVEKATDAFKEIAEEEDGVSFDMLLDILIWGCIAVTTPGGGVVAIVRLVGGTSVPLAVPKDTRLLKGSKTAKKATFKADNLEEIMKEFKGIFEETGDDFKVAGKAIDENLRYNMKLALEDRTCHGYTDTFFHLTPVPIQDAAGATRMDENVVSQVTVGDGMMSGYVSQIAAEPEKTVKTLTGISIVDPVRRKHNIGMDPIEPGGAFAELRRVLYELPQGLRWKADEENANLRVAMRDLQENDVSSQKALNAVASDVAQGSRIDPWDHKKQKEENPRPHSSGNV